MNTPETPIREEMLSAFLDGELMPDENEQVVAALEQSESLRLLLAELKQIRREIQNLPKHTLAPDCASRIVDRGVTTAAREQRVTIEPTTQSLKLKLMMGIAATAAAIFIAVYSIGIGGPSIPMAGTGNKFDQINDVAAQDAGVSKALNAVNGKAEESQFAAAESPSNVADPNEPEDEIGGRLRSMAGGFSGFDKNSPSVVPSNAESVQPFYSRDFDDTPDAIVQVSLPDNVALSSRWIEQPRSDSFGEATEKDGVEGYSLALSKTPATARSLVTEGTPEEIAAAFQEIKTNQMSITFLKSGVDAASLGLPYVESMGPQPSALRRSLQQSQVATRAANPARESKDAQSNRFAGVSPEPVAATEKRIPSLQPSQLADSSRDRQASDDSGESARRYRILLVVEPPELSEQLQPATEQPPP